MQYRVALLGTSIAIDSICAALGGVPGLELLRFESPPLSATAWLQAFAPDAVIFDTAMHGPDSLLYELMLQPGLLLVGFDVASQQLLLLSGSCARFDTVADLLEILSARGFETKPAAGRTPT